MLSKLRVFCARDEIRARLIIVTLSLIALVYAAIVVFGRTLPAESPEIPLVLRLHPERILAMIAAALGMFRLIDRFQKGEDLIKPLLWILYASIIHLASIGVELGWLPPGRG